MLQFVNTVITKINHNEAIIFESTPPAWLIAQHLISKISVETGLVLSDEQRLQINLIKHYYV